MLAIFLAHVLVATSLTDKAAPDELGALIDTIESMQPQVKDFRCEYEGSLRVTGPEAKKRLGPGEDGISHSFGGVFVWKRGGDIFSDTMHIIHPHKFIRRNTRIVRAKERRVEDQWRYDDSTPRASSVAISDLARARKEPFGSFENLFLICELKRLAADTGQVGSVSDGTLDGRPVKVVTFRLKNLPRAGYLRFWVDLRRGGHVVRRAVFRDGDLKGVQADVKLASFRVGGEEVWMPVRCESLSFGAHAEGKLVILKEPTVVEVLYVVQGTMLFNQNPGKDVFTLKYKPGTLVSDRLRKMSYEFGQQNFTKRPTRAKAERVLRTQLTEAEKQKLELVVASRTQSFDWAAWLPWGFGALAIVSSAVLWMQRRGR